MASEPEETEQANYKTWVLKVSIHCEGCEKKIKRILHKVKGVYAIEIDAKQNRVTVTGNVDSESLIQKLVKYGKHPVLLPENKTESKEKEKAAPATTASVLPQKKQAEKGKEKVEFFDTSPETTVFSGEVSAPKPVTDTPTQQENTISDKPPSAYSDGKNKEKEVKKEETKLDAGEISNSISATAVNSSPANFQPVYATVSYHTSRPSTSYAYYTPPPLETPSSYTFHENFPPPPEFSPENFFSPENCYGSMNQASSSEGSYDMFNDENPNACKLM